MTEPINSNLSNLNLRDTQATHSAALISPDLPPEVLAQHFEQAPLRLGLMASGSGTNVEAIVQAIAERRLNAQIQVLIYNKAEAGVSERADRLGILKVFLNHREFASREALDQAIVETMQAYQVDWVIMAGWMRIVTPVLIDAFPGRVLNIHPSLLPSFPGSHAVEQAFGAGVKITGCTVHRVELQVDSGPIIAQAAVPVLPDDTLETLHQRIQVQEHRLFPRAIVLASTPPELA